MKCIIISAPSTITNEPFIIKSLIDYGLKYYHLRKPGWDRQITSEFLSQLPEDVRKHIIVHDHYELINEFSLMGSHHNQRNKENKHGNNFSCSCHSVSEIEKNKSITKEYLFLSPVFSSISKPGYVSGFTHKDLLNAAKEHIIDEKVIALGGITPDNISKIKEYGFGGVAVLGFIWEEYLIDNNIDNLLSRYNLICNNL